MTDHDRIARLVEETAALPPDEQDAAFRALSQEDREAMRNFAVAKAAHWQDRLELAQAGLAELGLVAAMRGFAALRGEMTPDQLAEAFLGDAATAGLLATEFDKIRHGKLA